jgi:uncharacterized protein (DUF488 family)
MSTLYTIGHSNHPLGHFLALLRAHEIALLCDVRTTPFSRFHPQYNQPTLRRALAEADIAYLYLGASLGGKPKDPGLPAEAAARFALIAETAAFRAGMARLVAEAEARRTAIMCAERDPADCHRSLLICPHVPAALTIRHILADGTLQEKDCTLPGV